MRMRRKVERDGAGLACKSMGLKTRHYKEQKQIPRYARDDRKRGQAQRTFPVTPFCRANYFLSFSTSL
jgi:hypothetical protein